MFGRDTQGDQKRVSDEAERLISSCNRLQKRFIEGIGWVSNMKLT